MLTSLLASAVEVGGVPSPQSMVAEKLLGWPGLGSTKVATVPRNGRPADALISAFVTTRPEAATVAVVVAVAIWPLASRVTTTEIGSVPGNR